MIGAHIMEWEFFAMWTIEDLEFCEYMFYSLTCGYFIYNTQGYGWLKNEVNYPSVYAICYYWKPEIAYT